MIRIVEEAVDQTGAPICSTELPVIFPHRGEAVTFIHQFLRTHFANGRSGYSLDQDYWWGSALGQTFELYRYRLTESE